MDIRPVEPKAGKVSLPDWEMYFEDGGSGDAVIFVHGGFPCLVTELRRKEASTWIWSWEQDFARAVRFIWYDRRGCYRSSTPSGGYDLESQADDIVRLMDELRISSAHLAGSSAGGPISIVFAAEHPDRILSLTLVGTALALFPDTDPAIRIIRDYYNQVQRSGRQSLIDDRPQGTEVSFDALWELAEYEERGERTEYLSRQRALDREAKELDREKKTKFYAAELDAVMAYVNADGSSQAKDVSCPVLVVHGSNDRMVPVECGRNLARSLANCDFRLIEGGCHGLAFRSPEVRSMIIEFIREHGIGGVEQVA